jgi:hypothetical protein
VVILAFYDSCLGPPVDLINKYGYCFTTIALRHESARTSSPVCPARRAKWLERFRPMVPFGSAACPQLGRGGRLIDSAPPSSSRRWRADLLSPFFVHNGGGARSVQFADLRRAAVVPRPGRPEVVLHFRRGPQGWTCNGVPVAVREW